MAHLEFLQSQIEEVDDCIQDLMSQRETFLATIPGISQILAASITAEIGDITRFDSPEKLTAFTGIDPSVYKSSKFTGIRMTMFKRGSPYLRRALWMASASARRFDPELTAFSSVNLQKENIITRPWEQFAAAC